MKNIEESSRRRGPANRRVRKRRAQNARACPGRASPPAALATGAAWAFLLVTLSAALLTSCAGLGKLVQERIEKPRVSVVDAKIDRLSFSQADLLFDLKVENPNKVGVRLAGLDYTLAVDAERFLEGRRDEDLAIEAQGSSTVRLPLTVLYAELFRAIARLADSESSVYALEVGFTFDLPVLGEVRVPLKKEGELPVLRLPSIELVSVDVARLEFTEADLRIKLAVKNPNPLNLLLDRFEYNLAVDGQPWADGRIEKRVEIGPSGKTVFELPMTVRTFFIGQSGFRLLLEGRPFAYALNGNAKISSSLFPAGAIDLPFDASGTTRAIR